MNTVEVGNGWRWSGSVAAATERAGVKQLERFRPRKCAEQKGDKNMRKKRRTGKERPGMTKCFIKIAPLRTEGVSLCAERVGEREEPVSQGNVMGMQVGFCADNKERQ